MTALGFRSRAKHEIGALVEGAYGEHVDPERLLAGLDVVADALNKGDLGRAKVAAVRLGLPDLTVDAAAGLARLDAVNRHGSLTP